jgi:hypothetical protein
MTLGVVVAAVSFIVGSFIQVAGFGYFLGGLKSEVRELRGRIEFLEDVLVNRLHSSAFAGRDN